MKVLNCLPHDVTIVSKADCEQDPKTKKWQIVNKDWKPVTVYPKTGLIARCSADTIEVGRTDEGVPIDRVNYGPVSGLPEPQDDVKYIVSIIAAEAGRANGRNDLVTVGAKAYDYGYVVGAVCLQA